MASLALLLAFPMIWPFIAKLRFKHEYTLAELVLNLVVVSALVAGVYAAGRYSQSADVEVLNGQVTGKERDRVSCEHSYSCNCVESCSGSGENRSCSTTCQTCHEHAADYDYNLFTSAGNLKISRVDRQGSKIPPRWTAANVGDPVAKTNGHTNYIKGAPDSLFSAAAEQSALSRYGASVPAYPSNIHDVHYLNRVIAVGVSVPALAQWNQELAERLRALGPRKQVNWVVVLTNEGSPSFADAVRVKWLGGKKNDVIVVLGVPQYPKLSWVRVLSWTDKELFKVQLRDDLLALGDVDQAAVFDLMERHTAGGYLRKDMADFEYLANEIQPPTWVLVLAGLLGVVGSVGLSLILANNGVSTQRGAFSRRF